MANKCVQGVKQQLPRVVNGYIEDTEDGIISLNGKSLYEINDVLRGKRTIRTEIYVSVGGKVCPDWRWRERANQAAAKPVVNLCDGSGVKQNGEICYRLRATFSSERVASAGLPPQCR